MTKTYKFAARPLASQRQTMAHWLVMCCWLYNNCLEQRILWWKKAKKSLSYNDQTKQLTELRNDPEAGEWVTLPVEVARSAIRRVEPGQFLLPGPEPCF